MHQIRAHGRGAQGVVNAAKAVVRTMARRRHQVVPAYSISRQTHVVEGTRALACGGRRGFDDEGLPVYVIDLDLDHEPDHGKGRGPRAAQRPAEAIDMIPEPGSGQEGPS